MRVDEADESRNDIVCFLRGLFFLGCLEKAEVSLDLEKAEVG
ncbi:hypothetical protein VPHD341_0192 [Vibrio phage D341]